MRTSLLAVCWLVPKGYKQVTGTERMERVRKSACARASEAPELHDPSCLRPRPPPPPGIGRMPPPALLSARLARLPGAVLGQLAAGITFGQRGSHAEDCKERLLTSLGRAQREELWTAHACDPPSTERNFSQPARPHRVLRRGQGSADPKTMLSGRGAARAHASRVTAAVAPVASTAALPPCGSRLLKSQRGYHAGARALACGPMNLHIHNEPASPPRESLPRWKGRGVPVIRLREYQSCSASWGACGPEVVGPRPACRFAT